MGMCQKISHWSNHRRQNHMCQKKKKGSHVSMGWSWSARHHCSLGQNGITTTNETCFQGWVNRHEKSSEPAGCLSWRLDLTMRAGQTQAVTSPMTPSKDCKSWRETTLESRSDWQQDRSLVCGWQSRTWSLRHWIKQIIEENHTLRWLTVLVRRWLETKSREKVAWSPKADCTNSAESVPPQLSI